MDTLTTSLNGVILTPLKIVPTENGDVLHALKATDETFTAFGEAYFSTVRHGKRKGWKKHTRMVLNLVVPVGEIGFVLFDDRSNSASYGKFFECQMSRQHYSRLTIPPGIWVAFYGKGQGDNMLLNLASIPHDPTEAENIPLENDRIPYTWT